MKSIKMVVLLLTEDEHGHFAESEKSRVKFYRVVLMHCTDISFIE